MNRHGPAALDKTNDDGGSSLEPIRGETEPNATNPQSPPSTDGEGEKKPHKLNFEGTPPVREDSGPGLRGQLPPLLPPEQGPHQLRDRRGLPTSTRSATHCQFPVEAST